MCPFHKMCVHSKEVNSEENYHDTIVNRNKKNNVIKIKSEDEVERPCVPEEAYSDYQHGETLADEDPPVESFLSFVQIKEEPQDISTLTGNGEVPSSHADLSCSDDNSFSSCIYPLYDSVTEDLAKMRRAKAAAARRECRRRQFEAMTEEERKERHRLEAIAQKKYRQRKLESMTEEERLAYRATIAETQRTRRHHRMDNMTEEELKAHRAAAAAAQRQKRQLQRQQMSEEELQMHRAVEAALRRSRRQANTKRELSTHRRAAADVARREIQQCQIEEGIDDEQIEQYVLAASSARQELRQIRRETPSDSQQPAVTGGDTSPEDLMVQLLMQAQHAAALQGDECENQVIKQEREDYPLQNRITNEHDPNVYMAGQPHDGMTDY
ncbi:uncharacterized protein [Procambarus clarkii]|uniref:uncharacterized protein n=1 Tax=Procambarus clarkii TaxID=6728 RepID=UPI003742F1BA